MKRKVITYTIISLAILIVVILPAILFGAVFRLRTQKVVFLSEDEKTQILQLCNISDENDIISTAKLNKNGSIFKQNTEQAIINLETTYPYLKVVQISAKSVTEMDIIVTLRQEKFSYLLDGQYYVLDEELKVLRVDDVKPENLITINPVKQKFIYDKNNLNKTTVEENILSITKDTVAGNFVGLNYKDLFKNLYSSIYKTVKLEKEGQYTFLTEAEILTLIKQVRLIVGHADERLVLDVNVEYANFVVDIAKPNIDLQTKINFCFVSVNELIKQGKTSGAIRCSYNEQGNPAYSYFENADFYS